MLCAVIFMPTQSAFATDASGTEGDISWTLSDGTLTITGSGAMPAWASDVPPQWIGYGYASEITTVVIEDGITSIGNCAFYGCTSLTSVAIPDSVTSIGMWAFAFCEMLPSVTIPVGVTSISEATFVGCESLTSITIPEGVTSIGTWAFEDCTSLTSIVLPNSLTSLGTWTFSGCSLLTNVSIPAGITSIGEATFIECTSLTSITIPERVTSIGDSAFEQCTALINVVIPEGVTKIGGGAFYGCSSLTNITLPDGVTSVGSYAFQNCASLTDIILPAGITSISEGTFVGCESLTYVTLPEGITSIGKWPFENCTSLTSITLPSSVTSIGDAAFLGLPSGFIIFTYDPSLLTADVHYASGQTYVVQLPGYDITWHYGDGPSTTTCQAWGASLILPADPVREGHVFNGWYTAEEGGVKVTSSTVYETLGPSEYYAQYAANTYTITWYVDGITETSQQTYATTLQFPSEKPNKTGHTFIGWYTAATGGTEVDDGIIYSTAGNSAYYAQFTANSYEITWNRGDGTKVTTNQSYGAAIALPAVPNRPGYAFDGWFTAEEGGDQVIDAMLYETDGPSEYYAKHTAQSYAITWDIEGATSTSTQTYDHLLALPTAPTKTGYTFDGWFTAQTGGTEVDDSTLYQTAGESTYYAQFTANQYTVTWNDGSTTQVTNQAYNAQLSIPVTPVKPGYTFTGWYTAQEGGEEVTDGTIYSTAGPTTYYAQYSTNSYTITWVVDGVTSTSTQAFDTLLTLPEVPIKKGYHFEGWWTEEVGGLQVTAEILYQTADNSTYYAHWIHVFSVTVPATLPLVVGEDGQAYISDVVITNNSTGDVQITTVTVSSCNEWTIVPYNANMANEKVDSKRIGFYINGLSTTQTGTSETFTIASPWNVPEAGTLPLVYDANLSATSQAFINECILEIVFVIDWAD